MKGVLKNFVKFTTLLKKRLWHRCFPVNFEKFLRTLFQQSTSGRLLLYMHKWCPEAHLELPQNPRWSSPWLKATRVINFRHRESHHNLYGSPRYVLCVLKNMLKITIKIKWNEKISYTLPIYREPGSQFPPTIYAKNTCGRVTFQTKIQVNDLHLYLNSTPP